MDNVVTLETAKRLKQAGFPQPEFEPGQIWYRKNKEEQIERQYIVKNWLANRIFAVECATGYLYKDVVFNSKDLTGHNYAMWSKSLVFAPTATDILREMPGAILVLENYGSQGKVWEVWKNGGLIADLENPAEAAAFAWLTLNEK